MVNSRPVCTQPARPALYSSASEALAAVDLVAFLVAFVALAARGVAGAAWS